MTHDELKAKLTADLDTIRQEIARLQAQLFRTEGALWAIAQLDSGQRPPAERRADAENQGERETG